VSRNNSCPSRTNVPIVSGALADNVPPTGADTLMVRSGGSAISPAKVRVCATRSIATGAVAMPKRSSAFDDSVTVASSDSLIAFSTLAAGAAFWLSAACGFEQPDIQAEDAAMALMKRSFPVMANERDRRVARSASCKQSPSDAAFELRQRPRGNQDVISFTQ